MSPPVGLGASIRQLENDGRVQAARADEECVDSSLPRPGHAGLDRRAHEVDGVRNVLDRLPSRELEDRVPMDKDFSMKVAIELDKALLGIWVTSRRPDSDTGESRPGSKFRTERTPSPSVRRDERQSQSCTREKSFTPRAVVALRHGSARVGSWKTHVVPSSARLTKRNARPQ